MHKYYLQNFPNIIVYFLYHKNKLVYVGKTTTGICRISSHIMDKDKTFDSFSFIEVSEENIDYVESYFIRNYRPKYNKSMNTYYLKDKKEEARQIIREAEEGLKFAITRR